MRSHQRREAPKMAKPTTLQMRFPALIASPVFGLALAPLSAMAATVISVGVSPSLSPAPGAAASG